VDGSAIDFGTAAEYAPSDDMAFENTLGALTGTGLAPWASGMTLVNDILAPAGVGARGTVEIGKLKLWQDTYFTPGYEAHTYDNPDDPVDTFYVHPGHYLCLGDNSGQSSDSRKWGLVPDRLLLGKAVFVFFPVPPFVPFSQNRVGFIR
jgi:signal peptidase I